MVTLSPGFNRNRDKFNKEYGFSEYEEISPYDISRDEWMKAADKLCEQLMKQCTPSQIILHKFFGSERIISKTGMKVFRPGTREDVRQYNQLCQELYARMEEKLKGCHVLEFPENTVSSEDHWLGLHPLHYHKIYYEYGAKALETITRNLPDEQEKTELANLKAECEAKFKSLLTEIELREQLQWNKNALNFMSKLASDMLTEQKFNRWLQRCASDHKKVAVLKAYDSAGTILCKALQQYNIDVVLKSTQYNFDKLTATDLEKCRKADIIVCASVHGTGPVTNGELTAIRFSDLI